MSVRPTREQVLALAPDASSAKAATGLLSDASWPTLGCTDEAVWGECKGSGATPYQTQVDLGAMVSRCSCPSRKFPCKHGLALLLLYAQQHPRLAVNEQPAWVSEWLNSRREKAERKEAAQTAAPVDPAAASAAAEKRSATRWKRIEAGTADLERWIADQYRRGLTRIDASQRKEWHAMAARMVDAQAPSLARYVEQALAASTATPADYEYMLDALGSLQLIVEAVRRRRQLSPARLADLRIALGWSLDREDVSAEGESVADHWQVLGQFAYAPDDRLTERRVWLRGRDTGRDALLLDFAYQGRPWDHLWITGAAYPATLVFYPGSVPLRAQVGERQSSTPSSWPEAKDAIELASQRFAINPWLQATPMLLAAAVPHWNGAHWEVHDAEGVFPLRLGIEAGWSLLAFCGGQPLWLMGEWDGRALRPLTARLPDDDDGRWECMA